MITFSLDSIPRDVIAKISPTLARRYRVVPVAVEGPMLEIAHDGEISPDARDTLSASTGFQLRLVSVSSDELDLALNRYYSG